MDNGIHFISGLPRSGSTLLAAILRQNPRLVAGMSSPVASLVLAMQRQLSENNEGAVFIDDDQRVAILRGLFDGYYHTTHPHQVVIDTNRAWCTKLPLIDRLFPNARLVACVRHVPWIVDSFERLVQANALVPSRIFDCDAGGSIYSRFDGLCGGNGLVGFALNAVREAYHGPYAGKILLLTYHTLTNDPARALAAVYDHLGVEPFAHDFANVAYDASEFDARLGMPGLHRVGPVVAPQAERKSVLPPDLFNRLVPDSFWLEGANNHNGVKVV